MSAANDASMDLIVEKPKCLPSAFQLHYHESSGYSSKEAECSSPENRTHLSHGHDQSRLHLPSVGSKSVDIHRRRHRTPASTMSVSNVGSLTIDESSSQTNPIECTVTCLDKSTRHLSPQADEHLPDFPATILSADQRLSSRSTALLAHRHYHIYDWTRLSFYDNVPSALNYLSEPLVVQDCSPTSTSSTDRQDSGLETSSVERHVDTLALPSNHLDRSLSSLSSCSSSNSHETNTLSTSSRLPTSRKIRVKWHSFTRTHRPSFNSSKYHLGQMSVGQLFALRRAASMRIHELFDTTRVFSSGKERSRSNQTNKIIPSRQCLIATAFSAVPKLIIRRHQQRKETHHDMKKSVFGLSLLAMTQRTGHPVPITIIAAMKYLRRTAMDSVGIFRKPGVSHRIKRLHDLIESNLEFHQFDDFSPYDISDVLKQYFRFLPECLFTSKLSPLFLGIDEQLPTITATLNSSTDSVHSTTEHRLLVLQYAILLLPDEHRLVLYLLLSFLNDVAKHSKSNQMSSMNLATCFAPTLFYFEHYPKAASSTQGMPDYREIHDQRKAMEILAFMIDHVRLLFLVPNELHRACHFSYIEIGEPCTLEELARRVCEPIKATPFENQSNQHSLSRRTKRSSRHAKEMSTLSASDSIGSLSSSSCENLLLNENNNNNNNNHNRVMRTSVTPLLPKGTSSYQTFIDRCIVEVIRESCYTKFKGWTSFGKNNEPTLACKKLDDGHPLGLWKSSVEIEAPPIEILNRLLNERHLWDDDFQSGSVVEQLNHSTHVYQYTINSMAPLASRYFCEVRSWRSDINLNSHSDGQNGSLCKTPPFHSCTPVASSTSHGREACVLVCTSIEHPKAHCPPTLVRAVTLASRYLIQSNGCGKSKVTHLSRVDLMGRSHEWYTKAYGSILTRSMIKLRDSFVHPNTGPETKV